jgi:uncharacterized protein with NRDE domain
MCTVSFVPISNQEFLLTSNRDETTERGIASVPNIIEKAKDKILAPVDPFAHGSWIAASDKGDVVCLLNGAFEKHKRKLPYRMSRGKVVMDYFENGNPESFAANYNLENIEPFTLVLVHRAEQIQLFELRWNGNQKFFSRINENEFHLWSSCTLYTHEQIENKKQAFGNELKQLDARNNSSLIELHEKFLYQDWVKPPQRVMQFETLSITSVNSTEQFLQMVYHDLTAPEKEDQSVIMNIVK